MSDKLAREPADADADREDNETASSLLKRREMLMMGAAAAATGVSAGAFSGTASAATERHGIQFDRVVNAVDDLGMDASGSQPIDDALSSTMNDGNTLIEFPPGTYYIENQHSEGSLTNWGMRGLGEKPTDVRFVTDPGKGEQIIKCGDGRGVLVENVAFDYSQERAGSLGLLLKVQDDLRVKDVHFVGFNPNEDEGGVVNLSPQVLSADGTAIVDGFVRTGATDIRPHRHLDGPANAPGIMWLGKKHKGTLVVRNSRLENAGENGIYASAPTGDIRIENSVFKNNNQAALRMGGAGSYIKNSTFVVDTNDSENENGLINPHAVIWETDKRGETGGYIEGCEFDYRNAPEKTAAAIWADGSAGEFTIRDTRIRLDTPEVAAIKLDDPTSSRLGNTSDRPWGVTLEKVSVTGTSSGPLPAIEVVNRPNTVVTNCCLQVSGDRNGIAIRDSADCRIEDTNIDVGGRATVFDGSKVATSNITNEASCPAPDLSGNSGGSGSEEESDAGSDSSGDDGSSESDAGGDDTSSDSDAGSNTETDGETKELIVYGPPKDIGRVDYKIRFEGDAKALKAADDELGDGVFEGSVWAGHTDSIALDGSVVAVDELTEGGEVTLGGEQIAPDTSGSDSEDTSDGEEESSDTGSDDTSSDSESQTEPKEVVVQGPPKDIGRVDYKIRFEGDAEALKAADDELGDGVFEGSVWAGNTDSISLTGSLVSVDELTEGGTLTVDGEEVDPDAVGTDAENDESDETDTDADSPKYPNTIVVDGRDTSGVTGYKIAVSGDLKRDAEASSGGDAAPVDSLDDRVSGGRVVGVVDEGVDVYRFSGSITTSEVNGKATVDFDK